MVLASLETPSLGEIALSAVLQSLPASDRAEFATLLPVAFPENWQSELDRILESPPPDSSLLVELARAYSLTKAELLTLALTMAVEESPLLGGFLTRLQRPAGRSRPLLGFVALALESLSDGLPLVLALATGNAVASEMIELSPDSAALADRSLSVPLHLHMALRGREVCPPHVSVAIPDMELPRSTHIAAIRYARLLDRGQAAAVAVRSSSLQEAHAAAALIASHLKKRPGFVGKSGVKALGAWCMLRGLIPIDTLELAPADENQCFAVHGYDGPRLIAATRQGSLSLDGEDVIEWRLDVPEEGERRDLWVKAVESPKLAHHLATTHRHSAPRISRLGKLARQVSALEDQPVNEHGIWRAAWSVERQALGHLAMPVEEEVTDAALVAPQDLRSHLDLLVSRCLLRDQLTTGLGIPASTRYRPGVRALFTGPPGTGKTLAAGWLAAKLHMPLFRIDLASVSSKYIGETEKNLARLLDQAEQSDVILLFDEADALFARRTAVQDAHDRYANSQTNYLLQRMESFEGIALLTSNHESQLDSAFTRRIDFVIEFSNPPAAERRSLWLAHLGDHHRVSAASINLLASTVEISGGHIRNAVLHAAVLARLRADSITWPDLLSGIEVECRKLRVQVPMELLSRSG